MYEKSLFIFRRDMRVEDNTGLIEALRSSYEVLPCFIFDPRLLKEGKYSKNALQFMVESLKDLEVQINALGGKLYLFSGLPHEIIASLILEKNIDAVFVNYDYTPFSIRRDEAISRVCTDYGIGFHQFHDTTLHVPGSVRSRQGKIYQVFTQFFRAASRLPIDVPVHVYEGKFCNLHISFSLEEIPEFGYNNPDLFVHGGRNNSLEVLSDLSGFTDYDWKRDIPAIKGTTGLSAHNRFGTVSIREVYHFIRDQLGADHPLISELYWRDFFIQLAAEHSRVFGHAFREKFDGLSWENDSFKFQMWCQGKTGFPIVDAGMRQLNTTGYMHNRVRMIVSSFLVKDLHIDWRWGERYFARKLVDYDPCVNNGNWQWAASTGADATPYFRIFNPWLQQQKYDQKCEYIKKWVPELRNMDPKDIHALEKKHPHEDTGYPQPIVDHKVERNKALVMFKSVDATN
ncbi:MAG: deoxyribodipyrimidine photo-lyase [Methanomethylovorans sp.]|nr:deoxyribodipyrimidine photo-lyase [Methanomethylovorans sp.]